MMPTVRNNGFLIFVLALLLSACGGGGSDAQFDRPGQNPRDDQVDSDDTEGLKNVKAYIQDGPYANVLVPCAAIEFKEDSCFLSTLPLIGMDHEQPTVDDIMTRVAVSHDWMSVYYHDYPLAAN